MQINIITLFPEWFESPIKTALLGRAVRSGLVRFFFANPREETTDIHRTVDDTPYGGGPGMVMMLDPLVKTLRRMSQKRVLGKIILLSASGIPFSQDLACKLSKEENITLICGRYEGIDARLQEIIPMEAISVGDAVLNGGEVAAMMVVEAVTRLISGFMGKKESGDDESFSDGLLEYPHYTRPEVFEGYKVPDVLLGGNHSLIKDWRRCQAIKTTLVHRPEMLLSAPLSYKDIDTIKKHFDSFYSLGNHLHLAFLRFPVMLGWKKTGFKSLTEINKMDIKILFQMYSISSLHLIGYPDAIDKSGSLSDYQSTACDVPVDASKPCSDTNYFEHEHNTSLFQCHRDMEGFISFITEKYGGKPFVVYANAPFRKDRTIVADDVRDLLRERHVVLLFATGYGASLDALGYVDAILRQVRIFKGEHRISEWASALIVVDRILKDVF